MDDDELDIYGGLTGEGNNAVDDDLYSGLGGDTKVLLPPPPRCNVTDPSCPLRSSPTINDDHQKLNFNYLSEIVKPYRRSLTWHGVVPGRAGCQDDIDLYGDLDPDEAKSPTAPKPANQVRRRGGRVAWGKSGVGRLRKRENP